jgi:hypothetical protein
LLRADFCLQTALREKPDSIKIRRNVVRLATWKASIEHSYNPADIWQHSLAVLKSNPNDLANRNDVDAWYSALLRWASRTGMADTSLATAFAIDRTAIDAFATLHREQLTDPVSPLQADKERRPSERPPLLLGRYYIEPYMLDSSR